MTSSSSDGCSQMSTFLVLISTILDLAVTRRCARLQGNRWETIINTELRYAIVAVVKYPKAEQTT